MPTILSCLESFENPCSEPFCCGNSRKLIQILVLTVGYRVGCYNKQLKKWRWLWNVQPRRLETNDGKILDCLEKT